MTRTPKVAEARSLIGIDALYRHIIVPCVLVVLKGVVRLAQIEIEADPLRLAHPAAVGYRLLGRFKSGQRRLVVLFEKGEGAEVEFRIDRVRINAEHLRKGVPRLPGGAKLRGGDPGTDTSKETRCFEVSR